MSEKFLSRIIALLNRAQPDGLTFDALTLHLYNSEQDFFGERPDMRTVAAKLRSILDAYNTHITLDELGAYHLRKGIPQQLSINSPSTLTPHRSLQDPKLSLTHRARKTLASSSSLTSLTFPKTRKSPTPNLPQRQRPTPSPPSLTTTPILHSKHIPPFR